VVRIFSPLAILLVFAYSTGLWKPGETVEVKAGAECELATYAAMPEGEAVAPVMVAPASDVPVEEIPAQESDVPVLEEQQ
jgi:hypothetical protein